MKTVVYLGPGEALNTAREILEPTLKVVAPEINDGAVARSLVDAVAIIDASMKTNFDREMLEKAPGLRVISTATTGADHIDSKVLAERGIPLFTLAGQKDVLHNLTPAAELSWMLLMASARKLRGAVKHVLDGKWVREEFPGVMLKDKTLGLIGCGRIGSWMARYALAFGMEVIGFDPFVSSWPENIRKSDLDSLLSAADFVSIHVPLNEQTRKMIGFREFALMKNGVILINTSRGAIMDENAFLNALVQGRIGASGVDVLEGEPEINHHPLVEYARTHDNLIITPHVGGFSLDAVRTVVAYASRRALKLLDETQ